jgi:hypothetical protein
MTDALHPIGVPLDAEAAGNVPTSPVPTLPAAPLFHAADPEHISGLRGDRCREVQAFGAGRLSIPNSDDALREQRLCEAIRWFWAERGFYGIATSITALGAPDKHRLYGIRSNLIGAMPPEMGGHWSTKETRHEHP